MMVTKRWIVEGRVQGVQFRAYTQRRAETLNLRGWVRNLPDGRVEVLAQGDATSIEKLDHWLRHEGSPRSQVAGVQTPAIQESDSFVGFVVLEQEET